MALKIGNQSISTVKFKDTYINKVIFNGQLLWAKGFTEIKQICQEITKEYDATLLGTFTAEYPDGSIFDNVNSNPYETTFTNDKNIKLYNLQASEGFEFINVTQGDSIIEPNENTYICKCIQQEIHINYSVKSYVLSVNVEEEIKSYTIIRRSSPYTNILPGTINNGDTIYYGDVIEVDYATAYPGSGGVVIEGTGTVKGDMLISIKTYRGQITVTGVTSQFGIQQGVTNETYYLASGSINIGTNKTNTTITGAMNTVSYDASTGKATYTLYSTIPSSKVIATISYTN